MVWSAFRLLIQHRWLVDMPKSSVHRLAGTLEWVGFEARTLTLATEPAGVSRERIAPALGVSVGDATQSAHSLIRQALVAERGGRLVIHEHLRELADEATAVQWLQGELSRLEVLHGGFEKA